MSQTVIIESDIVSGKKKEKHEMLTLSNSERPKLHRVFGHSECKRIKNDAGLLND